MFLLRVFGGAEAYIGVFPAGGDGDGVPDYVFGERVAEGGSSGSGFSSGGSFPSLVGETINATNTDHTHNFSGTTGGESANHTHTYSFTTSTGSADGAEARPESAAALICIRY